MPLLVACCFAFCLQLRWLPAARCDKSSSLAMKGLMSSELRFVPRIVLTSPAVEINLLCEAVIRVPEDDRSMRRVLGILLEVDQRTEVSEVSTPGVDRHAGGRRDSSSHQRAGVCLC